MKWSSHRFIVPIRVQPHVATRAAQQRFTFVRRIQDGGGAALICALFVWCLSLWPVRAHDPGLSNLQLQRGTDGFEITIVLAVKDAAVLANELNGVEDELGAWTPRLTAAALARHAAEAVEVVLDDQPRAGKPVQATCVSDEAGNVTIRCRVNGVATKRLGVRSTWLGLLPFGHRQLVTVLNADGSTLGEQLFSPTVAEAKFDFVPMESSTGGTTGTPGMAGDRFASFFGLGLKHILLGFDHLLFLFTLLVVSRTLVGTFKVISCFTVAHSISLALATFDVVRLPGAVVEPLIAASIVFVAIENVVRREIPSSRLGLVFGFGLIHGLGFASVLSELGVGSGGAGVGLPLFSFNLGVEVGQLLVAAPLVPLLAWAARSRMFDRRWVPACSVVAALAGAAWLVERVRP